MDWLKLSISAAITIVFGSLLGFVIDIVCNTGGSGKTFTRISLSAVVISSVLFLLGVYKGLTKINPAFNKALLLICDIILSSILICICYIFAFVIALYIVAPIMSKLGYHVTMP